MAAVANLAAAATWSSTSQLDPVVPNERKKVIKEGKIPAEDYARPSMHNHFSYRRTGDDV